MKKKTRIVPLIIALILFSCNEFKDKKIISLSDINTDFSVSKKLDFKHFRDYDIVQYGVFHVNDTVIWYSEFMGSNIGTCYNLNTGKALSTVGMIGKATYEFTDSPKYYFVDDSVQFYNSSYKHTIKTFSKNDIIKNVPTNHRKYSVVVAPDSISVAQMIKLPNGNVLATIIPTVFDHQVNCKVNDKSLVVFNDKEAKAYETINYDSYLNGKEWDSKDAMKSQIKNSYAYGRFAIKGNDLAVFAVDRQFILYTFDINKGKVLNEKHYTELSIENDTQGVLGAPSEKNEITYKVMDIKTNDELIVCLVESHEKESRTFLNTLYIFDWNLNPIDKLQLPKPDPASRATFTISNDCKAVYLRGFTDEGISVQKADIIL